MKTRRLPLAPAPDPAHEQAALIAQLALHSTFPAADIEYFRRLLAKYPAAAILAALDRAQTELVAEGYSPAFPADDDAHSVLLLHQGLHRLERLFPAGQSYPPLQAAA